MHSVYHSFFEMSMDFFIFLEYKIDKPEKKCYNKEKWGDTMAQTTKKRESSCEDCVFYDYDEDWDTYSCQMNLDEDEMVRFLTQKHQSCPYYRYYDEYKSVQKQN